MTHNSCKTWSSLGKLWCGIFFKNSTAPHFFLFLKSRQSLEVEKPPHSSWAKSMEKNCAITNCQKILSTRWAIKCFISLRYLLKVLSLYSLSWFYIMHLVWNSFLGLLNKKILQVPLKPHWKKNCLIF